MELMKAHRKQMANTGGFTLVELLTAMVVGFIVLGAVYATYTVQQRTVTAQEYVTEMQQTLRAGMGILERDIRMAAFGPNDTGQFKILEDDGDDPDPTKTNSQNLVFTTDANNNGKLYDSGGNPEPGELLTYQLYNTGDGRSALRKVANGSPIAENIERIDFFYTYDDDGTLRQTSAPTVAQLKDIRSIQVSMLARAERPDPNYINTTVYTPASGVTWDLGGTGKAADDNFRRRLLITTVQCRNLGL